MRSDNIKNTEEKAEITEVSAVDSDVKKQRFGLKIFPETLEMVDTLFEHDNCKSRSEFIGPFPPHRRCGTRQSDTAAGVLPHRPAES